MLSVRTWILLLVVTLTTVADAASTPFGVALSAKQKQQFIGALVSTSYDDLEAGLPRKLRRLHAFKPYFSMYELASTAYSLVLESPEDARRWRALAKLDSCADGEYAFGYQRARKEALSRNPRLFEHCPQFRTWSDHYRRDHTEASNQSLEPTADRRVSSRMIISTFNFVACLALVSGGSAPSR